MATQWSEGILLAELGDEPELSEELSAIFEKLKTGPTPPSSGMSGGGSVTRTPHVILNFGGVSYLNSSHIAALLRLRKRLLEHRRQLVLCGLGEEIWSMFLLTGLDKVFQFEQNTMTALARVQLQESDGRSG